MIQIPVGKLVIIFSHHNFFLISSKFNILNSCVRLSNNFLIIIKRNAFPPTNIQIICLVNTHQKTIRNQFWPTLLPDKCVIMTEYLLTVTFNKILSEYVSWPKYLLVRLLHTPIFTLLFTMGLFVLIAMLLFQFLFSLTYYIQTY